MTSDVTVVGMGNLLYRDEGVGVYAAHYLQSVYAFEPGITILDGATLGFALTDLFDDGARILVLDAVLAEAPPGTVFRLPASELLRLGSDVTPTAHEVDPIHLLKQATALDVALDLSLVGIVPRDAHHLDVGLTPEVLAGFQAFVDAAVAELGRWGVSATQVGAASIDEVIESLVEMAR